MNITSTNSASLTKHWPTLLVFIFGILIIQGLGSFATMKEIPTWYATLNKAAWNPPPWVFGPVWSILYLMIAVAGWRVWIKTPGSIADKIKTPALRFYFIQLLLNLIWSPLFFGLHRPLLALVDILLMVLFASLTLRAVRPMDRVAFWLLVPYLAWILYATSLNAAIVWLN